MSALRDQRIGRRLALTGGGRMLAQAEFGGTRDDNKRRVKAWRNRCEHVPLEAQVKSVGYVPIPRYMSLVPIT